MTPLSFNADHFRRDFILVVSSMYVLYAMKLLRKYSNDAMLCLTPNLTYALIHEVTVEKLWELFLYFLCNQCTSLLKALWGRKCHSIVISSYDFRFFIYLKSFHFSMVDWEKSWMSFTSWETGCWFSMDLSIKLSFYNRYIYRLRSPDHLWNYFKF